MSDVEEFSHAAKLGGLRTVQIDRYVANRAAVNCVGPPSEKQAVEHFVRYFHEFLKQGSNTHAEKELRRSVLLMVTEGRSQMGTSDRDAATVRNVVDDVFKSIA